MQIIDYFRDERQYHWLEQIRQAQWRAAELLVHLLEEGNFHQLLGRGTLFILADGDRLASFLTLADRDCIDDAALHPWIGFVYTAPEFRGQRCAGRLIDHAVRVAGECGAQHVYICTDHVGLYEKYGFTYLENRVSIYGEDSRVLLRHTTPPAVSIEVLTAENFAMDSLDGFVRRQQVSECWRRADGRWQLIPCVFTEEWDESRLREEAAALMQMHADGGIVLIARTGETVIGFASLGPRLGSRMQYVELCGFHVSQPWRNRGVGRRLFEAACDAAERMNAEKLYISAHSSRESQAAYRALGCTDAMEPDPAHMAAEPCDVQMEYDLCSRLRIRFGRMEDLPSWMALVRSVAWNFPGLETEEALAEHKATVSRFMAKENAICALQDGQIVGVLLFSRRLNQLCCMAVAPQYRRRGAASGMFRKMLSIADPERPLTVTTFREGDPLGMAARAFYQKQGFVPDELIIENGHPCQVFVRRKAHAEG